MQTPSPPNELVGSTLSSAWRTMGSVPVHGRRVLLMARVCISGLSRTHTARAGEFDATPHIARAGEQASSAGEKMERLGFGWGD
jgi:hypothetical protein